MQLDVRQANMTMTTESWTNSATALSRKNFSGWIRHATIFSLTVIIACSLVV